MKNNFRQLLLRASYMMVILSTTPFRYQDLQVYKSLLSVISKETVRWYSNLAFSYFPRITQKIMVSSLLKPWVMLNEMLYLIFRSIMYQSNRNEKENTLIYCSCHLWNILPGIFNESIIQLFAGGRCVNWSNTVLLWNPAGNMPLHRYCWSMSFSLIRLRAALTSLILILSPLWKSLPSHSSSRRTKAWSISANISSL